MNIKKTNSNMATFAALTSKRLLSLGKFLGRVLSFSLNDEHIAPGRCLAVHLDEGGIDVAYGVRRLSRVRIIGTRHYPSEKAKYPTPEQLAAAVDLARNDFAAAHTDMTLIIPKAWTIIKQADFPSVVRKNLSEVVSYELDRLTPLSAEQAYYDYQIIRDDDNRLQIIIAVVKVETLEPYLHALMQRGIQLGRVIVNLSAYGALSDYVQGGGCTLFLNNRPGGYEAGLVEDGQLTAVSGGSFTADPLPEEIQAVAEEINSLLKTSNNTGKKVAVVANTKSDAWSQLTNLISVPVRFLGEIDLKLSFLQREHILPYTALGGALESLLPEFRGLNLLNKGRRKPEQTPFTLTILLIAGLAALGIFAVAASLQIESKKVAALEREIAARSKEVKQIETLKITTAALEKEINAIEQFKTARPMVLNLLKELTRVLPKNAWLTRVHTTDTTVNIEGYAMSATDILSKLEASRYFKKVEFASPTFRDPRMNAERFVFKMEIEGAGEEKGKNEKKQ